MEEGLIIGIHIYTTDKCRLKSHGLIFGGALFRGKNEELDGLISGEASNRERIILGVLRFCL